MSSPNNFRSTKSTQPQAVTARGVKYSTDLRPHVSVSERAEEGVGVFQDHMEQASEGLRMLLSTLEGFRRDMAQLKEADSPVIIHMENVLRPFVTPSITPDMQIDALVQALTRCAPLLEGKIEIEPRATDKEHLPRALSDLRAIHANLGDVSHGAKQLHDLLLNAERSFDAWNAENGEEYAAANIHFDRDGLNLASTLARAMGERAVRLDIDVVAVITSLLDQKAKET